MPFTKVGPDKYSSPSGNLFNTKQVQLYHANDGFPGQKEKTVKHPQKKKKHVKGMGSFQNSGFPMKK